MLMILDGFGLNPSDYGNAIAAARTPNLDKIFKTYPHTSLAASGTAVGLPDGQMGNSEVGHLNIGAGRIVYQELSRITNAIADGSIKENEAINHAIEHAKSNDSVLHIFGLLSDGGVHSHIDHIKAVIKLAAEKGVRNIVLHAFMDGRDVPPTSGIDYVKGMSDFAASEATDGMLFHFGVVSGRYYAMDRDKRWERLELAYDALTLGQGRHAASAVEAVEAAYAADETDEFIIPTVCDGGCGFGTSSTVSLEQSAESASDSCTAPRLTVADCDSIIFCNFRPDRAREITRAFVDPEFDGFERKKVVSNLTYVCMTQYDATIPNVEIAFPPQTIKNTLGEYLASVGKTQLRIAETEKYAHVTFFFNGGVEAPNPLEDRILIPSPKVATYDQKPEMSAYEVTEAVKKDIASGKHDVYILNFANADMVGHTGVFDAAVKAVEALDECAKDVIDAMLAAGGQVLLTADHGNADCMLAADGTIVTAHSTNPVPLVYISESTADGDSQITPPASLRSATSPLGEARNYTFRTDINDARLSDIAPTLLALMDLPIPPEMTGRVLITP